MFDETDAGLFYTLLRLEEASLGLRTALKLGIVDELDGGDHSLADLRQRFSFTFQAARTYFWLLVAMRILEFRDGHFKVTALARRFLAADAPTSRAAYLSMGTADDVSQLISMLQGGPGEGPPLYGEEGGGETLMDITEVGSAVANGLASRARNFATPLADAIAKVVGKAESMADIGAGSPYVADACLKAIPQLTRAVLVDRPNGMRFARAIATQERIDTSRIEFCEQDFFDSVPGVDFYCISNTAHDWRREDYLRLMHNVRCVASEQGLVCIHEPLLQTSWSNDREWLTALWMACYALTLFKLTAGQGSCYSITEHDAIHRESGFTRISKPLGTCDGCTALFYRRKTD